MPGEVNNAFFIPLDDSFFIQHGKHFSSQSIKKNALIPFKEHPQFPLLVDSLIRKHHHHVVLRNSFSEQIRVYLLEALLQHLSQENTPYVLRDSELIYLNSEQTPFTKAQQKIIGKDFQAMHASLNTTSKYLLFAIHDRHFQDPFLSQQLENLSHHAKCRLLVLSDNSFTLAPHLKNQFTLINIHAPNESDRMTILKQQRTELENFHHVLIPEELLTLAYSLAERYLSANDTIEKALLLLDTCAARTSANEHMDITHSTRPPVTSAALIATLSGWTHIPASHLPPNKLKLNEFMQGMQQRVFGQDAALTLLSHELQQSQVHLQQHTGPFCSLLFSGPKHSGKKTVALALAEQLFKQPHALYFAQPASPLTSSIANIKLWRSQDNSYVFLKEAISQAPYAIIMFEEIEQLPSALLDDLHEMLSTGYLHDDDGNAYSFRQAILLFSTTLGSNRLTTLTQSASLDDEAPEMDLMQLIMNEQKRPAFATSHDFSPQELVNEILPEITAQLPIALCQYLHVIPFLPLNKTAIEHIIRLKLKLLIKLLDSRYGIEFSYAPEVIRYLVNDVLIKQEAGKHSIDIDKALKLLYFTIEQAILSQTENKNRPNQLFLQLNETGQLLKCDWLVVTPMRHHAS